MFILFFSYFSFYCRFHLQNIICRIRSGKRGKKWLSQSQQAKARELSHSQSYFFTGKVVDGLLVMRKIEVCYTYNCRDLELFQCNVFSFCNWCVNHWKLWRLKIQFLWKYGWFLWKYGWSPLTNFSISWKPLTWGVIFRVRDYLCLIRNIYIYKMVIFFVFLSCTAMCSGNLSLMKLQVGWFWQLTYLATIMINKAALLFE